MCKVTDWLLFFFMAVSLPAFSDDNVIDEVVWIIGDEAIYRLKSNIDKCNTTDNVLMAILIV